MQINLKLNYDLMEGKEKSKEQWLRILEKIRVHFNKETSPDLNAVLFLIGLRELGELKKDFTKEEKQDLMHIAICRLLSQEGYYILKGIDSEGWPSWEPVKKIPKSDVNAEEELLKRNIITYFESEKIW